MKIILSGIYFLIAFSTNSIAQETIYPALPQSQAIALVNGTIHVGNGQVVENGSVMFDKGKITYVGRLADVTPGVRTIDVNGKHVYPGLISSNSDLGLREVASGSRSTNDFSELGEMNPSVRAIVAYNTDSKITNTLRSNGILLSQVAPRGGLISGTSSVVQLDAWNWEDAVYKMDGGIHFNMPNLINRPNPFPPSIGTHQPGDAIKASLERIENVKNFFQSARSYIQERTPRARNLKYEAVKGLFDKTQKFYVHCDVVKEMLVAIDFAKEFGFDVVIIGGSDSWMIPELLKENNVALIISQVHRLPTTSDDDVDLPFKIPAILQKAGVLYAINDDDGQTRGRNLMFLAGTAVTYGLSKEEALSAITLNAAKILGISDRTGSLEVGKDANIVVSEGDILDMKSSAITHAYIQGRTIDLNDKHKQLYQRYKFKYGLK